MNSRTTIAARGYKQRSLRAVASEKLVEFPFEQEYFFCFLTLRLVLLKHNAGVAPVYRSSRRQYCLTAERLAFEYRQCCAYQSVAIGGIQEGGFDHSVGDCLYPYLGRSVDSDYLHFLQSVAVEYLGGPDRHCVAVGVYKVNVGIVACNVFHYDRH